MFEKIFNKYNWDRVRDRIYNTTEAEFKNVLQKKNKGIDDLYSLFSPVADAFLEEMAKISYKITRLRFGNTIQLYTPLYISNECNNECLYCGFNIKNKIKRITLTMDQIRNEYNKIYQIGFRHILLLTGEDKKAVSIKQLSDIARNIHEKFSSVSIEVYPMAVDEYKIMIKSGIDGLTLYQETYNKINYNKVHPRGKKKDFYWRINSQDRGGIAGFRKIGIGSLLGLSDWRVDGFFTALHGLHLTKNYWKSHIQISFPRLRVKQGSFTPAHPVGDRDLTHLICAMRIILPDAGLLLSTREPENFRDNIFPIGITMMSAGSKTEPGGYTEPGKADKQFAIEDIRNPEEVADMIFKRGFDPVWKDWDSDFLI